MSHAASATRSSTTPSETSRETADGVARVRVDETVVWMDAAYRYVLLFTGDLPDVGRRSLAVEPMTCPRNAFRTGEGLIRLAPGDRVEARWGIVPQG